MRRSASAWIGEVLEAGNVDDVGDVMERTGIPGVVGLGGGILKCGGGLALVGDSGKSSGIVGFVFQVF
jgi:glutaminase